jgi:hypothetical protein
MAENEQTPTPPAAPATHIDASLLSDRLMERIEHEMDQHTRDTIEKARIAGREARLAEQAKEKAEREASSKRAADAVKEVVDRDRETTDEERPEGDEVAGYDLAVPEVSAENQKVLEETVHDVGILGLEAHIPPEQLQTLVNVATDFALQEPPGLDYSNQDECAAVLRGEWGKDYDQRVALVQRQVQQWGPAVAAYLSGTGIGNSPGVVKAIYQFASGNAHMTKAQAEAEIAKMTSDRNHGYWKGEKNALAKMRTLREIASKGEAAGTTRTVAAVATTSDIESEIAAIRATPDYTSLDSKKRAPLVARMQALMAAVHG